MAQARANTEAPAGDGRRPSRPRLPRDILIAGLAGLCAFLVSGGTEWVVIRLFAADPRELDWVSDVLLSVALASAVLWRLRLTATQAEKARLERAGLVLDTQLRIAAEIQSRLIPAPPAPSAGWRWAARLQPAGKVGGDFYDFVRLGPDALLVAVADISGKGIPAALLLASTQAALREMARESQDPAAMLGRLSAALHAKYEGLPYLTCLALRVEPGHRRIVYANAGHPAGLILGPGRAVLLSAGGPPVGLFPHVTYRSESVALAPGDVGLLVTDGVADGLEEAGYTTTQALAEVLARLGASPSPDAVCDGLMRLVEQGASADGQLTDDRTIVVFALDGEAA